MRIAGIDNFLMLGMLAAVCSVIPVVGTSLVWGPAAVYLLVTHHAGKAIFLLIWARAWSAWPTTSSGRWCSGDGCSCTSCCSSSPCWVGC